MSSTEQKQAVATKKPVRATPRKNSRMMERETGIEPATLSLGSSYGNAPNIMIFKRN